MSEKQKNHYVDNAEFYSEMRDYIYACRESEKNGEEYPRIPNSIGQKIWLVAHNLAYKPNFINYTFKEEMIGDAIENSIRYIKNFNPDKYNNAHAYFTTISWQAFVRRIQKEDKQFRTKVKYVMNMGVDNIMAEIQSHDAGENFDNTYIDYLQDIYDKIETKEKEKKEKAEKKKGDDSSVMDEYLK